MAYRKYQIDKDVLNRAFNKRFKHRIELAAAIKCSECTVTRMMMSGIVTSRYVQKICTVLRLEESQFEPITKARSDSDNSQLELPLGTSNEDDTETPATIRKDMDLLVKMYGNIKLGHKEYSELLDTKLKILSDGINHISERQDKIEDYLAEMVNIWSKFVPTYNEEIGNINKCVTVIYDNLK